MRIIGGTHRSRTIQFPDAEGLRPTPDRVRETLFNWLGQDMTDRNCLDLFAGSGALGLEAASRGASSVVLVEKNRAVFRALQENVSKLGFHNVALRNEDGLSFMQRGGGPFDVIFLDPPFSSDYLPRLLPLLQQRLAPQGTLYIESGAQFAPGPEWRTTRQGKAGAVHYQLLQHANHD